MIKSETAIPSLVGSNAEPNDALERLFGPLARSFRSGQWPQQALSWHAPLERLGELGRLGFAQLIDLEAEKTKAVRHRNGDHQEQVLDSVAERHEHWQRGFSLCYVNVEQALPAAKALLGELAQALAFPRSSAQINAYASPAGHGFGFHFDAQEVMIVQLCGAKTWHLAPNTLLDYPPCNAVAGWSEPPRLSACIDTPFPTSAPAVAEAVQLVPGSVLYLPRGYWHSTAAGDQPSLSLTLTFPSPNPLDLLLEVLAKRLERDPRWRRPLFGLGDLEGRKAALADTQALLQNWMADDEADRTAHRLDRQFRVKPGVDLRLAALQGRPVLVAGNHCCPLAPEELGLARWLSGREQWFGLVQLSEAVALPLDRIERTLEAFVRLRLLDQA